MIITIHNEVTGANLQTALSSVINYVISHYPSEMEFTTIRKLLAPYNGDTLTG